MLLEDELSYLLPFRDHFLRLLFLSLNLFHFLLLLQLYLSQSLLKLLQLLLLRIVLLVNLFRFLLHLGNLLLSCLISSFQHTNLFAHFAQVLMHVTDVFLNNLGDVSFRLDVILQAFLEAKVAQLVVAPVANTVFSCALLH